MTDDNWEYFAWVSKAGNLLVPISAEHGRDNEWIPTLVIRDFQAAGPHDVPDLEPIDAATAERLIQQTHGITGATEL